MFESLKAARKTRALPAPVSVTDEYMDALLESVNSQTDVLEVIACTLDDVVTRLAKAVSANLEGREALSGSLNRSAALPADIPGYTWLRRAGYKTLGELPTEPETLREVSGIGPATAAAIAKYLQREITQ